MTDKLIVKGVGWTKVWLIFCPKGIVVFLIWKVLTVNNVVLSWDRYNTKMLRGSDAKS